MILSVVIALVVGIVAGAGTDELLRGRDVRSRRVIAAGVAGAIAGLIVRRAMSDDNALIDALAALLGAGLVAFATRVRMSATLERESASAVLIEIVKERVATVAPVVSHRSVGGDS